MASFLPIIEDILPMILPASISVVKAVEIMPHLPPPDDAQGAASGVRVISRNAVVDKSGKLCATGKRMDFSLLSQSSTSSPLLEASIMVRGPHGTLSF